MNVPFGTHRYIEGVSPGHAVHHPHAEASCQDDAQRADVAAHFRPVRNSQKGTIKNFHLEMEKKMENRGGWMDIWDHDTFGIFILTRSPEMRPRTLEIHNLGTRDFQRTAACHALAEGLGLRRVAGLKTAVQLLPAHPSTLPASLPPRRGTIITSLARVVKYRAKRVRLR